MHLRIKSSWKAGGFALPACLIWILAATGQDPVNPTHTAALSGARVDALEDGRYTITMDSAGELAGSITLMLSPKGDGTYGGEWAITVAHADHTDPATGQESVVDADHAEGEPHPEFLTLVHQGAMNGTSDSATLTFVPEGLLELVANIAIAQGAGEFAAAKGSGIATLSSLNLNY